MSVNVTILELAMMGVESVQHQLATVTRDISLIKSLIDTANLKGNKEVCVDDGFTVNRQCDRCNI